MFSAMLTFVLTVIVGFCVASWSNNGEFGIMIAIAFAAAVIVYKLTRLYKALVPENEPVFPDDTAEDDNDEVIEEVPEEESYGVNDLADDEE